MRNSMIIYRSFYDAIKELPGDEQCMVWTAILDYGLDQISPNLSGVCNTIFNLIKPQLDANLRRYENGLKPKQKARSKRNSSRSVSNDNVNDNVNVNVIGDAAKSKASMKFIKPELHEMKSFFVVNGYTPEAAEKCWHYYNDGGWKDSTGKSIVSWKQKVRGVWFKPENKIQHITTAYHRNANYNPAAK